MCGIVSLFTPGAPLPPARLKAGADALAHRGPDGEGFWFSADGALGLGHRRLSIIDLATGAQPLVSADGRVAAVVNGEFYGWRAIRAQMEEKGHVFSTRSDSEILIALYREYGTDCLQYLRGEFAFVLWDGDKNRLFAARDRFGIKPLCYAQQGSALYLASEAKAIFAMGLRAEWDADAFYHAACMQYTPQDATLFRHVCQLKPGHMLLADAQGVKTQAYWDLDYPPEPAGTGLDEGEAIAQCAALFDEAVALRLQADVPVCFHLSGGLDSSAVLGAAARLTGRALPAFTVSFDGHAVYDELEVARASALKAGADFHPVVVTQEDLVTHMPAAVYHGEGLAINGHLTAKYLLNKAIAAAGYKVALTGEGADEVLAGYPHFRQDLAALSPQDAPWAGGIAATNEVSAGVQIAAGAQLPTQAVAAALGYVPAFLQAKASMGRRMTRLLSHDLTQFMAGRDVYADFMAASPVAGQLRGRHVVNQSSYLWTKTALANYILRTLGDGMEMSRSIEGRLPFLDHRLFEFCRGLPMHLKIRDGVEKYILREAVKRDLTPDVYRRQKHPFMAPPVSRFSSPRLMEMLRDKLDRRALASLPFYDADKVQALLDALPGMEAAERTATEPVIMTLLTAKLLQEGYAL